MSLIQTKILILKGYLKAKPFKFLKVMSSYICSFQSGVLNKLTFFFPQMLWQEVLLFSHIKHWIKISNAFLESPSA